MTAIFPLPMVDMAEDDSKEDVELADRLVVLRIGWRNRREKAPTRILPFIRAAKWTPTIMSARDMEEPFILLTCVAGASTAAKTCHCGMFRLGVLSLVSSCALLEVCDDVTLSYYRINR